MLTTGHTEPKAFPKFYRGSSFGCRKSVVFQRKYIVLLPSYAEVGPSLCTCIDDAYFSFQSVLLEMQVQKGRYCGQVLYGVWQLAS